MTLMRVRDLMTTDLFTLDPEHDFVSADQIMRLRHVRHVPVVRQDVLLGLVTHRDLMRAQAKLFVAVAAIEDDDEDRLVRVRISDFMTPRDELVTCTPATPADDAARLMLSKKIGCVLVVEDDRLLGILTEADLVAFTIEMMAKARLEHSPDPIPEPDGGLKL